MAAMKFPCALCQRRMAIGPELAGRRVRCPFCHQVVVAPAPATGPTDSQNPFDFSRSPDESDSIFGEPADDDLFGASPRPVPAFAPPPTAPRPAVEDNPLVPPPAAPPPEPAAAPERRPSSPGTSAGGRAGWFLAILVPYALFMTVMAIFYYVRYSRAAQEHPLEMIPDLMGEYQRDIKKDGKPVVRAIRLPPADQPLPDKLVTTLGRPIRVGAIEVTPLSVEYRKWTAYTKEKGREDPKQVPIRDTLVLHVRLKNVSPDLTFYPTDPYFDRNPKYANDRPYTFVDVGGRKFFGGIIEYITEPGNTERTWLQGQEDDNKPLGPGESRETVFLTRPSDAVFDAVQKSASAAVWRVQVRRGLVNYGGKEIPVSAVVGVAFTAADVKRVG